MNSSKALYWQLSALNAAFDPKNSDLCLSVKITLRRNFMAGTLKPGIDRTFASADAAKAYDQLAEGHAGGKIVIDMKVG